MEPMARLTVDEIEEDGSGEWSDSTTATMDYDWLHQDWEQSVGSSEQMDNLTDLSMQIDRDLV